MAESYFYSLIDLLNIDSVPSATLKQFKLYIYLLMHLVIYVYIVPWHVCYGQRIAYGNWFSPFTLWVSGIKEVVRLDDMYLYSLNISPAYTMCYSKLRLGKIAFYLPSWNFPNV